jgi:histidyl-tRNA synthetase
LKLIQELRSAGLSVDYSLTAAKSDKQFKRAQELKAAHVVRLEASPSGELMAKIKNLKSREEWTGNPAEAVRQLCPGAERRPATGAG